MRRADVGDGVCLEIHEVTGERDGPVLAVLGGVHGDELEGVMAARMLLRHLDDAPFRGTVRVVPVANPPAFAARTRSSPADDANLARVFPGASGGTLSQRIARVLTDEVITGASLLIDLHSAGVAYEMPVFIGYVSGQPGADRAAAACRAFGAPFLWEHAGSNPGRSLSAAADLGVPSCYVEGSGGGGLAGPDLDRYLDGLLRVMRWLGMTRSAPPPPAPAVLLAGGDGNTDAQLACSADGFCVTRSRSGARVAAGSVIADILDDEARLVERISAPRPGTVMMLRRTAAVRAGDGIAMLGPVPD